MTSIEEEDMKFGRDLMVSPHASTGEKATSLNIMSNHRLWGQIRMTAMTGSEIRVECARGR